MASQHSSSYNGSPVDSEPPSQGLVDSEPPSQELPYEEVDSPGRDTDPGEFEAEAGYGHKHWDPQLPVDPADMAAFKEKLEAGELDQKLMDILKSQAPQKNNAADKTNNVEVPKQMSNAEIDRKLKQDIAAQKEQFAKATEKVNRVVAEVEAEAVAEASKAAVQETKQEKQVENKPVVVGEYTDIGSEHQGLRYDPKHYDGEDEEAEMMAALNNRETIRYNLGL